MQHPANPQKPSCNVGVQLLFGEQPSTLQIPGHRVVQTAKSWLVAVDGNGVRYLVSAGDARDWILYPLLANDRIDEDAAVRVAKCECGA